MRDPACRLECPIASGGWCERHRARKTAPWVALCRARDDYFRLWEEGCGPGQSCRKSQHADPPQGSRTAEEGFPPLARQAWNLATALAAFVADGFKTIDKEQYQKRLEICNGCESRRDNRCLKCGCRLSLKARARAFQCPADKWPEV